MTVYSSVSVLASSDRFRRISCSYFLCEYCASVDTV